MARRLLDKLRHVAERPASSRLTCAETNARHAIAAPQLTQSEQAHCSSHSCSSLQNSLQTLPSSREEILGADCADFFGSEEPSAGLFADIVPWRSSCASSSAPGFHLLCHKQNSFFLSHYHVQQSSMSSLKRSPAESFLGSSHCIVHISGNPLHRHMQMRFMSTPKIKLKVDRLLDAHADVDKLMRPIFKIRTLIRRQENHMIKVKYLDIKRKHIGLASKPVGMKGYLKVYPNLFELFSFPNGTHLWCRLTKTMVDLLEEEKKIYMETEAEIVLKLRKLLMMSKDRCIKAGKIDFARKAFGFPEDFATRVAPAYPQYFNVVGSGPSPFIELASWDDKIAISALERKAKEEAFKAGYGEIETRGQPLEFKITHSPGMFLKKKNLELLERWQKLPYVSPYQDHSWVPIGTALSEKRIVAVLHELLSLTVDKRALMMMLGRFREEFDLPQSIGKIVNRFPGIFYLSLKGNMKTVFLREGYKEFQHIENHVRQGKPEAKIIEDHPLLHWRMKIAEMAREGPRLYAAQKEKANEGRKQGSVSPVDVSELEEDEDEAIAVASGSEYVDSECDESDTEDEYDDDDMEESEEEDDRKMKNHKREVRVKKEIW